MLRFIKRPKEVYQKLKGCPVQREVYDALDFHRPPHSNISDRMTYAKLANLSDTDRRRIPLILDQLIEKGLIQKVLTKKKYVFQCLLLDITEAEVIQLNGGMSQRDAETEKLVDAIPE